MAHHARADAKRVKLSFAAESLLVEWALGRFAEDRALFRLSFGWDGLFDALRPMNRKDMQHTE